MALQVEQIIIMWYGKKTGVCEDCGVEEVAGIVSIAINAKYWWHTVGLFS